MELEGQAGLKVDETFLGVSLHIDQEKWEAWIEMIPPGSPAGVTAAVQRAKTFGYKLIPEDEDPGVFEFLAGGVVRHWLLPMFNEGEEEAAA